MDARSAFVPSFGWSFVLSGRILTFRLGFGLGRITLWKIQQTITLKSIH